MSTHRARLVLGAAGAGLFLFACSEAVPPAAQGAFTLQFVGSATTCPFKTHPASVGDATPERYGLLKNGSPGVVVECLVVESGGTFEASGVVKGDDGNWSLQFRIPSITPAASVDEPALGNIKFRSPETSDFFASPNEEPCEFWFTGGQELAAGRIWVNFHCADVSDGVNSCEIGDRNASGNDVSVATVAVQNCDQ